ncbi:MAG: flap endonuclease-1 [Candidatus Aenigmatarchaeota archaeon]
MGVQFTNIVKGKEITLNDLFDKRIAIDAFNWIYQFLTIIRQPDGEPLKDFKGRITSHLSGIFYRTLKLMEANIRPIYVFDGKPPEFKRETTEQRRDVRAEALREWKEALEREDFETAKKYAQRSATITNDIIEQSKRLLDAMGVPYLQASSEGEALCAFMCKNGDAYAVATQDYDSLLFGAPKLIRNLSITGKKKRKDTYITINPELIILEDILENLGINHEQLIILGILIGTDYNPGGIPGYGPKKALELVREKKTLHRVFEGLAWGFEASPEEIFEFFKKPPTNHYEIKFGQPDTEKIKKILCDEFDFSEERIENALKKIEEREDQSSLSRWIKK